MAVITKGVQLWYKHPASDTIEGLTGATDTAKGQVLPGLIEFGDITSTIGNAANRDKIEVTTLADDKHMFVDGLIAEDESSEIEFTFLFDQVLFDGIRQINYGSDNQHIPTWTLDIPVGKSDMLEPKYASFSFEATATATMSGAGVNEAINMSVVLKPTSLIRFAQAN